jgi:hypothetical protein
VLSACRLAIDITFYMIGLVKFLKNCVNEVTSFPNLSVFDLNDQGMTTEAWRCLCNQLMGI